MKKVKKKIKSNWDGKTYQSFWLNNVCARIIKVRKAKVVIIAMITNALAIVHVLLQSFYVNIMFECNIASCGRLHLLIILFDKWTLCARKVFKGILKANCVLGTLYPVVRLYSHTYYIIYSLSFSLVRLIYSFVV